MPIQPTPARQLCRHVALAILIAASSLLCGLAVAAPDGASDPFLKLLADKGLLVEVASTPPAIALEPDPGLLRKMQTEASAMVIGAMNFIGLPYSPGGGSAETGFDCSGFTRHVFEMSLGLVLPRRADEQAAAPGLVDVQRDDLKPGDLVFFNTLKRSFSHVGIYIGENRFIHAPRAGAAVRTEDMSFAYWAKRFTGARRAEAVAAVPQHVAAAASGALPARP